MGRDRNGEELGTGIYQRKDASYCGRFTNRFGKRQTVYGSDLTSLKKKLKKAIQEDLSRKNIRNEFTLNEWFEKWLLLRKPSPASVPLDLTSAAKWR